MEPDDGLVDLAAQDLARAGLHLDGDGRVAGAHRERSREGVTDAQGDGAEFGLGADRALRVGGKADVHGRAAGLDAHGTFGFPHEHDAVGRFGLDDARHALEGHLRVGGRGVHARVVIGDGDGAVLGADLGVGAHAADGDGPERLDIDVMGAARDADFKRGDLGGLAAARPDGLDDETTRRVERDAGLCLAQAVLAERGHLGADEHGFEVALDDRDGARRADRDGGVARERHVDLLGAGVQTHAAAARGRLGLPGRVGGGLIGGGLVLRGAAGGERAEQKRREEHEGSVAA